MAKTNKLAEFSFEPSADAQSAQIHIKDDKGATLELTATREQLELLADSLDEFLADTEDADEIEGGDEDEDEAFDEDDDESADADGAETGEQQRSPSRR
ncbi:hypothetical protein [Antarcticirhabdus aurantiaca]|uniref:hypothetical protein n=1 Tax=Antarcticirhabdus aurantiaca TaxID=2606717 RepID=UPI00131A7380|nr:hypothetical protein [Antarcticirhabdus aurantiaca]